MPRTQKRQTAERARLAKRGPAAPASPEAAAAIEQISFRRAFVSAGRGRGTAVYPKGLAAGPGGAFYLGDLEKETVTRFGPGGQVFLLDLKAARKVHI